MLLAALANLFNEEVEDEAPLTPEKASHSSAQGSLQGVEDASMATIICTALAHLQLPVLQADSAQASAFFRRSPAPVPLTVPPSEYHLRELHACWRVTPALARMPGPLLPCRIRRGWGWVACHPLSLPSPP